MIQRVLVIKLGALGDIVLALGPFAAIRRTHPAAIITLLTTAPYDQFLRASGYFDDVWIDDRPALLRPDRWLALRRRLRGGGFDFVYDLQTSDRSGWYFRMMGPGPRPGWSGIARGCSHPHSNPQRDAMHTSERQKEQLAVAGIAEVPCADLSWVTAEAAQFGLAPRYALLVPGGAPHRPDKRWPAEHYAELARDLVARDIQPVVIGGPDEAALAGGIAEGCPGARSLAGKTSFEDIVALARDAAGAVGNDTGPMHLIAAAGCPSLVLFSAASDPSLTAPRGAHVKILQRDRLAELAVDDVLGAPEWRWGVVNTLNLR